VQKAHHNPHRALTFAPNILEQFWGEPCHLLTVALLYLTPIGTALPSGGVGQRAAGRRGPPPGPRPPDALRAPPPPGSGTWGEGGREREVGWGRRRKRGRRRAAIPLPEVTGGTGGTGVGAKKKKVGRGDCEQIRMESPSAGERSREHQILRRMRPDKRREGGS